MATGDQKRAVMTDDIDNAQSSYPVMSLRPVDAAPDAAHTNNLISSAAVAAKASSLAAGMAIIATGNTHAAITKGQYVYIQDHATLAEGMYEATANIAANGTLSTSNVAAKPEGAANALKAALDALKTNTTANLSEENIYSSVTRRQCIKNAFACNFQFTGTLNGNLPGVNGVVATLPDGYRPSTSQLIYGRATYNGSNQPDWPFVVNTDGTIVTQTGSGYFTGLITFAATIVL